MSWNECLNSSIKVALLGVSSTGSELVCAVEVLVGVCVEESGLGVMGVEEVDVCAFSSFWVGSSISENKLVKLYIFGLNLNFLANKFEVTQILEITELYY